MEIVVECYKLSARFPRSEMYGLTAQLRRAAVSFPCNIAEGAGRWHPKEFLNFLSIAAGSLNELETLLITAFYIEYITRSQLSAILKHTDDAGKMLSGLRSATESQLPKRTAKKR